MPGPDGLISLALDFDGSLVEAHVHPLRWRSGAREFVIGAARSGIKLWLHSCRCTVVGAQEMPGDAQEFWRSGRVPGDVAYSWDLHEEMRLFLEAEGVLDLVELWTAPGKPICDAYADDRAERPDWLVLAGELGVVLSHEVGRPEALGGAVLGAQAKLGGGSGSPATAPGAGTEPARAP